MSQLQLTGVGYYKPVTAREVDTWDKLCRFRAEEPLAFGRDSRTGHITASAFILSPDFNNVLLTHHRKLDRWLQLGGHCDGIADVPFVALKEAYEESGLSRIEPLRDRIFDVDIHEIPAHGAELTHLHYDVRYLYRAAEGEFKVSDESHDLAWVPLTQLEEYTDAASVLIVRDKLAAYMNSDA